MKRIYLILLMITVFFSHLGYSEPCNERIVKNHLFKEYIEPIIQKDFIKILEIKILHKEDYYNGVINWTTYDSFLNGKCFGASVYFRNDTSNCSEVLLVSGQPCDLENYESQSFF